MLRIDEVFEAHSRSVYRYLLSLTGDPSLSEELTQETFYQAVRSVDRYDGKCKITTWLCGIAKNVLSAYRRKHPVTESLDAICETTPSAEAEVLSKAGQAEILRQMQSLPPETREIMYLRIWGGLSFREISEILGCTENRARVTYYRGKEKLKKELTDDE